MKFTELNAEQQARAIEAHRDINLDDNSIWCDFIQERFHSELNEFGFEEVESRYSGFCSQGDGASFTADNVDIEKFLRKTKRWTHYRSLHEFIRINDITCKVVRDNGSRYVHYNTTEATLSGNWHIDLSPKQESLYTELEKEIDNFITEKGQEYYSELDKHYYHLLEDEQVKETIIANEMEFEEDPRESCVTYI
ncbi:hypothetical protein pEaSNUABM50_00029 [Erwinia phage pEa_SNUABM_50]|uniref:Uncharacterized protein n=1 Tax=Erwinia phage pEa_SNUABM_50 TaxID=2768775 RepID=A0A7L8ZNM8_9CAUD|nr:hypothetical protein pEaSNUABM50_00029 [Erwinia phage pEa_SNUABM_50]QXO11177.1 hypothetical protein pEaSNUABM19_00031 [Erwinia phage pEa_SNUABM_19]